MDADFWNQRWREGRIGFHQDRVTPLLEQYWDALAVPAGTRVLVPLAGKSLDMTWLAARGYRVLGVELSQLAVSQFFAEHHFSPTLAETANGVRYSAGAIEVICGDAFALDDDTLQSCAAIYDRAALIALPPTLRARYAQQVYARLPSGCRGLLVTLEYPQREKTGPPFSVIGEEIHERFARDWTLELLERRDILASQPGFAAEGVSALHTSAWRMLRH